MHPYWLTSALQFQTGRSCSGCHTERELQAIDKSMIKVEGGVRPWQSHQTIISETTP
jgi:hypothetical protein